MPQLDGWIDYDNGLRIKWDAGVPVRAEQDNGDSVTALVAAVEAALGFTVSQDGMDCDGSDGVVSCGFSLVADVLVGSVFAMKRDLTRFVPATVEPTEQPQPVDLTPEAKEAFIASEKATADAAAATKASEIAAAAEAAKADDAAVLAASDLTLLSPEENSTILALDADGVVMPITGWEAHGTDAIAVGWRGEHDGVRYWCTASVGPPDTVTAQVKMLAQRL